jgi:hypothetical protein
MCKRPKRQIKVSERHVAVLLIVGILVHFWTRIRDLKGNFFGGVKTHIVGAEFGVGQSAVSSRNTFDFDTRPTHFCVAVAFGIDGSHHLWVTNRFKTPIIVTNSILPRFCT